MADVKGDLAGLAAPGGANAKVAERVKAAGLARPHAPRLSRGLLGRLRRAGASGARHRLRDGAAPPRPHPQPERDAGRRPRRGLQDRRRQRPAPARPEGPARDAAARGRQRGAVPHAVREHLHGEHRRDPARAPRDRVPGRREVLRRARPRDRRPHADRGRQGRDQHPGRRQAAREPPRLRDDAALAPVGTLRAAAGGGRPGQAQARLLLRRGAPPLQRRPEGAPRPHRAGGPPGALQGRGGVVHHAEPAGRARHRPRAARQPGPARAARLHAPRPAGREGRRDHVPPEPEARRREGDHGARRRRGAGLVPRREGPAAPRRARPGHPAAIAHRADLGRGAAQGDRILAGRRPLREGRGPRIGLREARGPRGRSARRARRSSGGLGGILGKLGLPGGAATKGRTRETAIEAAAKSAARAMGSEVGRRIIRGVLGSILGGRR